MKWMVNFFLFLFCALSSGEMLGQKESYADLGLNDSLYREDQFYIGFTYNILNDLPEGISAAGFSGGTEVGFIRDFPLNSRRNLALGIGLGWAFDNYGHNLFIGEEAHSEDPIFRPLFEEEITYDTNRISMQAVEVPLQFRWRTSTSESYSFWRIYTGFKLGYVYYYRTNFEQPRNVVRQTSIPGFNPFRVGATFSFGYSTFNFNFYYSLNSFFNEEAVLDGEELGIGTFKVGLIFYLL